MREKKLTRRDFLKTTAATGLTATLPSFLGCHGDPPEIDGPPPNVILITADDLGWRDLGCYGNRQISTPNIDRLAREGAKFENAFVVASSCSPSRASLLTGQYPHTNGVTGLTHRHIDKALTPGTGTIPSNLKGAGHRTALEGKWHVSPLFPTSWYGFDERLSGILPKDHHIESDCVSVDFIERHRDRPFYLELNYMNNHRDDFGEFSFDPDFPVDPERVTVPEYWSLPNWPEIRLEVAKYYSQTMKMDGMIGRVLDRLDTLGISERTLVLFVSDNGPPFPGNKMTLYDRGIGTPLLVRWPGRVPAGLTVESLVSSIDVMPTLLEACGLPVPGSVQDC